MELTPQATVMYEKGLVKAYPYHTVQGTVGLWSKLPLSDTQPIDVMDYGPLADAIPAGKKMASNRALRTTVATDRGPLTVYVAHPGSVRVNPTAGFWTASRDIGVQALGKAIAADPSKRVVLLGDMNGSMDDRAFDGITSQLRSAQAVAGAGFGFSWPASFPVVRIDQILVRGVEPDGSWVLPANGSDHRRWRPGSAGEHRVKAPIPSRDPGRSASPGISPRAIRPSEKSVDQPPEWILCAPATGNPTASPTARNRRYTGDLVKRAVRRAGLGGHGVGSPKSSSPSLAPGRKANRCRSAQRVPVFRRDGR